MNWNEDLAGDCPELKQAIGHFKASMDAWSCAATDAALSRPRTVVKTASWPGWRLAAGWALGCVLATGCLAGALHQAIHRQEMARLAAQKAAQKAAGERVAAEQAAALPTGVPAEKKAPAAATVKALSGAQDADASDEALLASVDSDVSRGVPAAMEPLAQLMDDSGTQ